MYAYVFLLVPCALSASALWRMPKGFIPVSVNGAVYNVGSEDTSSRVFCPNVSEMSLGCGPHDAWLLLYHDVCLPFPTILSL